MKWVTKIKTWLGKKKKAASAASLSLQERLPHIHNLAYGGLLRTHTPAQIAKDLIHEGYARMAVGGLVATDKAHQTLLMHGLKPPRWQ